MKDLESIPLEPQYTEIVSAERFLEIYTNERENLDTAKPHPSPLGSQTLGRVLVVHKRPVYSRTLKDQGSDK